MAFMKLIYKLSITILTTVFITALILSVYSFSVQRSLINSQLIKKGQVLARLLSDSVVNHLISYDFYAIKLLMDPLTQDGDIESVALIGHDGYIKMHSDLNLIGQPWPEPLDSALLSDSEVYIQKSSRNQQNQYQFSSPVEIDHNRIGIIQITLSDTESLLLIESFGIKMLLLTIAVLFLAVIIGYVMSRQISNPLIELSTEINRFMMKRSEVTVQSRQSNEIIDLKRNFTSMMKELQSSIEFRVKTEKMAVLGNLSSVLAHEVKNPLEPIKGSAEMLKIKYPQDPDITRYAQIIQSEVSDLITFLDSFLDVSRMNDLAMGPVDVNKALGDILVLMEYSLQKEHIETEVSLSTNSMMVRGNSSMLKQVFLNLLINAIQAKDAGYGYIEIETGYAEGMVQVRIKDYGMGVEEGKLDHIFQAFFTTKKEGTGIGLSTSRHIIELHKGSISVASTAGAWTEFLIRIPALKEDTDA